MRAPTLLLSFWLYAETAVSTARTSVLTAHPGGEITLVCSLNKSCFRVSWWKVQPNGIRPLAPVLASSRIAPKTTLDKKCALWISAVQEYDAATYYCAENWNPGQLGNGFTVAIGEQEQSTVEEQLTRPKSDKGYKKNTTSSGQEKASVSVEDKHSKRRNTESQWLDSKTESVEYARVKFSQPKRQK
ncbi:uncharacterized protein [Lepisosteus oculatus]|uniref:uncharacterized protein isoform X4 n=1 Tax=Lepisosteus oculatus TaxID=7918 RepID=UPI00073FF27F|nr:PREDICTED: uncharacterized protein LOC107075422 isoform X4 [Lepisosteus oculatus]